MDNYWEFPIADNDISIDQDIVDDFSPNYSEWCWFFFSEPAKMEDEMKSKDVHLVAILDRSGSMANLTEEMRNGFNTLKAKQLQEEGNTYLTLVTFDNKYERLYTGVNIKLVPDLTADDYFARGSTALLDAVGETIEEVGRLKNLPKKVLVVIATDGYENASTRYSKEYIKGLISDRENRKDNPWSFIFMGAGVDAFGDQFGYTSTHRTINTTKDWAGTQAFYGAVGQSLSSVRSVGGAVTNTMNISGMSNVDYGNNPTIDNTTTPDTAIPTPILKPRTRKSKGVTTTP